MVDGLDGIDQNIDDDLLDVLKIAADQRQVLGQLFLDRDTGVAHGGVDQPQGVGDGFVDRDRLLLGCARQAGKIFEVGDDLGNPAGGHFDVADELQQVLVQKIDGQPTVFTVRCLVYMRFQDRQQIAPNFLEQRRVVDNQIDRVVDLVSDSGNQSAECLHLLGLVQLRAALFEFCFGFLLYGDITDESGDTDPLTSTAGFAGGTDPVMANPLVRSFGLELEIGNAPIAL